MNEKEDFISDDEKTISQQLAEDSTDLDDVDQYEIKKIAKKQKRQYTCTYRFNLDAIYKVMSIIKEKHILSHEAKAFLEKNAIQKLLQRFS